MLGSYAIVGLSDGLVKGSHYRYAIEYGSLEQMHVDTVFIINAR